MVGTVIRSMTGYGRKEANGPSINATLEVRSVNNRYIDIQVKVPRSLTALEPRIRKAVQDRFSRGRFDVFIARTGEREQTGKLLLDETRTAQYIDILNAVKTRFDLKGEVDLSLVAGFPDLIAVAEEREDMEVLWQVLATGLGQTLDELERMRSDEGRTLVEDMARRLALIESLVKEVQALSPLSVESARKRMAETLNRILNEPPDPVRLAQEIAVLAERTDVTEELTRLNSHIGQYRNLLAGAGDEPVGRKLDFLLQEMGREANTIASKAMNAQISYHIVSIKAELEKIREQAQNIE